MTDAATADVLSANTSFYEAFRVEDVAAMDALWARRAPVACVHPGWPALLGRARVMASWKAIFEAGAPAIECAAAEAHVLGDVAFVTCTELVDDGQLVATNLFAREDGSWRMVHHHAGPLAAADSVPAARPTGAGPN
jgi:ketosteroid isomerase-like protein